MNSWILERRGLVTQTDVSEGGGAVAGTSVSQKGGGWESALLRLRKDALFSILHPPR